ncbi:unnamed protein product [Callosobruchus maculatus]|uniref:Uncharacterized protein n=1 Tax=Callosobruchus maculatus TaxID=64391 RepID=A0A653DN36_CALMS|nr:unnamed protein product [Callosobruchus maculatus]
MNFQCVGRRHEKPTEPLRMKMQQDGAYTIYVTTRAMGFGSMHTFSYLYDFSNAPPRGSIYQLYRLALTAFERKVQIANSSRTRLPDDESDYCPMKMSADMAEAIECLTTLPEQLELPIRHVEGIYLGSLCFPRVGKNNYTPDNRFIPQSEQITISNLRETVEALSDKRTDRDYRRLFYKNNPIPGARWQGAPDDPILLNADEIIPRGYDSHSVYEDIRDIMVKLRFLKRVAPECYSQPVIYAPAYPIQEVIGFCNKQEGMRCCDRNNNESLQDYYRRMRVEGDVKSYPQFKGWRSSWGYDHESVFCLLGELPAIRSLRWSYFNPMQIDDMSRGQHSSIPYWKAYNTILTRQLDRIGERNQKK